MGVTHCGIVLWAPTGVGNEEKQLDPSWWGWCHLGSAPGMGAEFWGDTAPSLLLLTHSGWAGAAAGAAASGRYWNSIKVDEVTPIPWIIASLGHSEALLSLGASPAL